MSEKISTKLLPAADVICRDLRGTAQGSGAIDSRHTGIPGFVQEKMSSAVTCIVGAGGLNGENAEGLTRKGMGQIIMYDGDVVELPNLNRQLFMDRDIGKNKAKQLALNLETVGYMGTRLVGYPLFFQEAVELGIPFNFDVIVCGVDNDQTRVFVSRYGLKHNIPVIFSAVSVDGNSGYVFVQEAGGPCFGCAFPEAIANKRMPCPGAPAIKDILKAVSGFTLYAVDSLLMERSRNWNYRMQFLAGYVLDSRRHIEIRSDCSLCGGQMVRKS